jgi:hypothetical protein
LQVLHDRRQRHGQRLRQLAHRGGAEAQPLHERAPRRVGERLEDEIERSGAHASTPCLAGRSDAAGSDTHLQRSRAMGSAGTRDLRPERVEPDAGALFALHRVRLAAQKGALLGEAHPSALGAALELDRDE